MKGGGQALGDVLHDVCGIATAVALGCLAQHPSPHFLQQILRNPQHPADLLAQRGRHGSLDVIHAVHLVVGRHHVERDPFDGRLVLETHRRRIPGLRESRTSLLKAPGPRQDREVSHGLSLPEFATNESSCQ